MNTIWADTHGVHDELTDAGALHDWLRAATDYSCDKKPNQLEFQDALLLRNSLRRLAAHTTADRRNSASSPVTEIGEAVGAVNKLLADRARTELTFRDGQLQAIDKEHASPCRSALAGLGHHALELLTGPTAVNLRACNAPHCVLYFVKSHPRREWCSDACGNRARAARHYQRVRNRKTDPKTDGANAPRRS